MIVSIIDCYQDITTHDKLILPSAITRILTHMHPTIPPPHFHVMGAIIKESIRRSVVQLVSKQPLVEMTDATPTTPSSQPSSLSALSSSSRVDVSLTDIWSNFNTCVLILVVVLTICLMRCVKWTLESIASLPASLALVVLGPFLHPSLLRSPFLVEMMMMILMVLALLVMMRWQCLSDAPFVTSDKRESSFVYESSLFVRGRASIGYTR